MLYIDRDPLVSKSYGSSRLHSPGCRVLPAAAQGRGAGRAGSTHTADHHWCGRDHTERLRGRVGRGRRKGERQMVTESSKQNKGQFQSQSVFVLLDRKSKCLIAG